VTDAGSRPGGVAAPPRPASDSVVCLTHRCRLLDTLGVPYTVSAAPTTTTRPAGAGGVCVLSHPNIPGAVSVAWPTLVDGEAATTRRGAFTLGSLPVFAAVLDDDTTAAWLSGRGGVWNRHTPIRDAAGRQVASVWRDHAGSVFVPFDPDEARTNLVSERYQTINGSDARSRAKRSARRAYYAARPFLPRRLQIRLRRGYRRVQERARFPRWPFEPAVADLERFVVSLVTLVAGEPVPAIAPWPAPYDWAVVLTHDVETQTGHDNVNLMRYTEAACGFRSSWNFVPERYRVDPALVSDLTDDGFEVGVHGLRHDGRDLESLATLNRRLPEIRRHAEAWGAVGFRSPATQRVYEWMPMLGFSYDSSYPDSDPYEPQAGGCCTWLPFFNQDMVELPITLPQDHTMFVILAATDETMWVDKAMRLRAVGGMALLITHPDYMLDDQRLAAYRRFLERVAADGCAWRALPRDVDAWWRERAASRIVRDQDGWRVVGPAAHRAQIRMLGGDG
jgi:hypothetical protein